MLTVIRGAGDLASGIALRLYRAGIRVVKIGRASCRERVCLYV